MDSSQNSKAPITPRRSQRQIQKVSEPTPEPVVEKKRVPGPRSMAKANRKAKLDQTAGDFNTTTKSESSEPEIPKIKVEELTPIKEKSQMAEVTTAEKKRTSRKKAIVKTPKKTESAQKRSRSVKTLPDSSSESNERRSKAVATDAWKEETICNDPNVDRETEAIPKPASAEEKKVIVTEVSEPSVEIGKPKEAVTPVELVTAPETAKEIETAKPQQPAAVVEKHAAEIPAQKIPAIVSPTQDHEPEKINESVEPQKAVIKEAEKAGTSVEKVEKVAPLAPEPQTEKQSAIFEKIGDVQESLEDVEIPLVSAMNDDVFMSAESDVANETPLLADESIISVPDSPTAPKTPTAAVACPRDSTFSPIVDATIHDSRPNIDLEPVKAAPSSDSAQPVRTIKAFGNDFHVESPVFASVKVSAGVSSVALRTSTPYAKKMAQKVEVGTPKRAAVIVARAKTPILFTEKPANAFDKSILEDAKINPMEKSILKSSKRKRSMSVADCESFAQKRVMFISPKIMDIGEIDEKMMASFIEEKENSMMRQAAHGSRRKRSLSTGTPAKKVDSAQKTLSKVKIPNFKAIHEQQFQKMESIAEHAARKAERARKLATPVKEAEKKLKKTAEPVVKPAKPAFSFTSKIPTRTLKRALSNDEPPQKKITSVASSTDGPSNSKQLKLAVPETSGLQRAQSEHVKQTTSWIAPVSSSSVMNDLKKKLMSSKHNESVSIAQQNREKVEERRHRNISLYKQGSRTVDQRAKNTEMLKGVRLNRRFELQMQHRREHPDQS